MPRPDLSRVPEWFHGYINCVEGDNLLTALTQQHSFFVQFLENLPADKRDHRYGPDKWTIKELLQHIIDAERVFAYRALCIARGEQQSLPGFEENEYAANSKAQKRNWDNMLEEFKAVRRSTEILFSSFDNEQLEAAGISNGKPVYVLAIGFIIAGHLTHHLNIIKERYL